jgi:drug/metabolite transporter (DMT)-like permease
VQVFWLPLAVGAGVLQIVRNAAQRGLADDAGPWGATLVRFLFGLPFTCVFLGLIMLVAPPVSAVMTPAIVGAAMVGALCQVLATAALIASMQASSFGLGSTFQHVSLPLAAVFGFAVLGDAISPAGWGGIGIATAGLVVASWPKRVKAGQVKDAGAIRAGLLGVASGACFAVSGNAFRYCGVNIDPDALFFSSTLTLVMVQTFQSVGLGLVLLALDRRALRALRADLRASLTAGLAGAAASAMWFAALALVPAALVRAINALIEAPGATLVGWVRFKEQPDPRKTLGAGLIVIGVVVLVMAG